MPHDHGPGHGDSHGAHGDPHGAHADGDQLIRGAWFYDLRAALLGSRGRRLWRTLADDLRLRAGDRVLDVGCGPGRFAAVLADRVGPAGSVVGVDASEEMVARARAKRGSSRVEFRVAQAQRLPFDDASFDGAGCTLVLHHVAAEDRADAVRELFRVLKPGGRLVVAEFDAEHRPLWHRLPFTRGHNAQHRDHDSLAEARDLADAAGFVDLTTGATPVRWAARLTGRKP